MKFSIVIPTLFAFLVGSVIAQSEIDSSTFDVSSSPTGTSSSSTTTSTALDLPPTPIPTRPSTTFDLNPTPTTSTLSIGIQPAPSSTTMSGGAVPTVLTGMQQVVLVGAGLVGVIVL